MRSKFLALSLTLVTAAGCQQTTTAVSDAAPAAGGAESSLAAPQQPPELLPNQKLPQEGVISGGQPTPEQLRAARDAGYRTVINMRRPNETGVGNEPEVVAGLGMDYISIPIDGAAGLTRENTEKFAAALEGAEYPVVLHCGSGNRIGALFALKAYWIDGKSAEEALSIGIDAGLTRLEPAVKKILETDAGS